MEGKQISLYLLTGFLGAGKTTLLNHFLHNSSNAAHTQPFKDTALIINEFGAVPIDHDLVEESTEHTIVLANGCLCCSVRADFIEALFALLKKSQEKGGPPLKRIIIETTGLADNAALLKVLLAHPRVPHFFRIEKVITVIGAQGGAQILQDYPEARNQVIFSDHIVLSKCDLADSCEVAAVESLARSINPTAELCRKGETSIETIFSPSPLEERPSLVTDSASEEQAARWHREEIAPFSLCAPLAFTAKDFIDFMESLAYFCGPALLRIKGFVCFRQNPQKVFVLQGVQGHFSPLECRPSTGQWPETRLVLLAKKKYLPKIEELFHAFLGKARLDSADKTALLDNPLAVPGLKF